MTVQTLNSVAAANDAGQMPDDQLPTDVPGQDSQQDTGSPLDAGLGSSTQPQDTGTSYYDQLVAQQQGGTVGKGGGVSFTTSGGHITGMGAKIIAAAEQLLGTPYKWGGNGAGGVDCSGLVRWAYQQAGIDLPRISYQQANSGKRVALKNLRPGDLVAWDDSARNPGADHIAIYLGNGQIIEAARPGTNVRIRALGSWDQDSNAWGVTGLW